MSGWWRHTDSLFRFTADLIAGEMRRLRPGAVLPPRPWPAELALGRGGLEADSLELTTLAAAFGQALHLQESGIEDGLLARRQLEDWVAIATQGLSHFDRKMTFLTSGSSGPPKACEHPLALLEEEISHLARLIGTGTRLLAGVPSHHIYGFLFTILLPARLGLPVIDITAQSPSMIATQLRPGDLVIGYPEFWRNLCRVMPRFPEGITAINSTAPLPRETGEALLRQNIARSFEIYGASETSGIGWRGAPDIPYRLFDFWQRTDDPSMLIRRDAAGETRIIALQDDVEWIDERHFRPVGRRDGAVQIGGVNVFPDAIAARLARHPEVAAASVRLMRPEEGSRLKAFIVPRAPDADPLPLRARLEAWSQAELSAAEQPKSYSFGAALPQGAMGKKADWPIA